MIVVEGVCFVGMAVARFKPFGELAIIPQWAVKGDPVSKEGYQRGVGAFTLPPKGVSGNGEGKG